MLRTILGIIIGIVAGGFVVFIVEGISHMIWSPPSGDYTDPDFLDKVSFPAKMAVIVAWFLGVLVGGIVARLISGRASYASWLVAIVLFAMMVITMMTIPHPTWMQINALAVSIAGAVFATMVTRKPSPH